MHICRVKKSLKCIGLNSDISADICSWTALVTVFPYPHSPFFGTTSSPATLYAPPSSPQSPSLHSTPISLTSHHHQPSPQIHALGYSSGWPTTLQKHLISKDITRLIFMQWETCLFFPTPSQPSLPSCPTRPTLPTRPLTPGCHLS